MSQCPSIEVNSGTYGFDVEVMPTPAPEADDCVKLDFVENQLLRIFLKRMPIINDLYLLGDGQDQQCRGGSLSFRMTSGRSAKLYQRNPAYKTSIFVVTKIR